MNELCGSLGMPRLAIVLGGATRGRRPQNAGRPRVCVAIPGGGGGGFVAFLAGRWPVGAVWQLVAGGGSPAWAVAVAPGFGPLAVHPRLAPSGNATGSGPPGTLAGAFRGQRPRGGAGGSSKACVNSPGTASGSSRQAGQSLAGGRPPVGHGRTNVFFGSAQGVGFFMAYDRALFYEDPNAIFPARRR